MPPPASHEAPEYSGWDDDEPDAIVVEAGPDAHGERLDKWLASRLPRWSRERLKHWIDAGHVRVNGSPATVRQVVRGGDRAEVVAQPSDDELAFVPEDVPFTVVHEDDAILVVDKRAGLVVHPGSGNRSGTLLNGLLHRDGALARVPRAGIVHRLDKDTSGLMVVAKTIEAQTDLVRQLQARSVGRRYVAIVHGVLPKAGRIDLPIGRDPRDRVKMKAFDRHPPPTAKPAATRFETMESSADPPTSFVTCALETGRTHQIRVHLLAIGHPLVGDPLYAPSRRAPAFARQALHAWRLALVHPLTGRPMHWSSALPSDLDALVRDLGFDPARLATRDDDAA